MKPTVDEYKIISEYLVDTIDWDRIYDDTSEHSKNKFGRDEIINHIKKLILSYPDHFDESIEGRTEFAVEVFRIRYGILNEHIYLLSDNGRNYFIYNNDSPWFVSESNLFKFLDKYKSDNKYFILLNYKHQLKRIKVLKITNRIKNYE